MRDLDIGQQQKNSKSDSFTTELLNRFLLYQEDLINKADADRSEVSGMIEMFKNSIGTTPNDSKSHVVEAMIKLMEIKTNTSQNVHKALDVSAKVIAAIKNHDGLKSNNEETVDLKELLNAKKNKGSGK